MTGLHGLARAGFARVWGLHSLGPGWAGFEFVHLRAGRDGSGLNLRLPQTWPTGRVLPGWRGLVCIRAHLIRHIICQASYILYDILCVIYYITWTI